MSIQEQKEGLDLDTFSCILEELQDIIRKMKDNSITSISFEEKEDIRKFLKDNFEHSEVYTFLHQQLNENLGQDANV